MSHDLYNGQSFFLRTLPGEWSYSIAGQLSWVNLIYEILQEAIILPLFFFVGKAIDDKRELTNRVRSGLIVSGAAYAMLSMFILLFAEKLLDFMMASPEIMRESAVYIRIESIANIFSILYQFALIIGIYASDIGKFRSERYRMVKYISQLCVVCCCNFDFVQGRSQYFCTGKTFVCMDEGFFEDWRCFRI